MPRLCKDWLQSYMKYTDNSESPASFRLWTGISTIAACLQRKCSLPWGTFSVYPNLYIVLVGPSGARKGTAMNQAMPMLSALGIRMAAESITREALIRELKQSSYTSGDGSKVVMHCSLTIFSQELTVFLGYNNQALMADLCDWYDCRERWTYRTKNMGSDDIQGVWVNLIGATTPDLLQTTLPQDAIGGGLTARMIFIFEPKKAKTVPIPHLSKAELRLREELQADLEDINMIAGDFKTTDAFIESWIAWYPEQDLTKPFDDKRFGGYFERRGTHTLKLSMIVNASRNGKMILDAQDLDRAVFLLSAVEHKMPNTFRGVGKSKTADVLNDVLRYIATVKQITLSSLTGKFYFDADKNTLDAVLQTLEQMRAIAMRVQGKDTVIFYRGGKEYE